MGQLELDISVHQDLGLNTTDKMTTSPLFVSTNVCTMLQISSAKQ